MCRGEQGERPSHPLAVITCTEVSGDPIIFNNVGRTLSETAPGEVKDIDMTRRLPRADQECEVDKAAMWTALSASRTGPLKRKCFLLVSVDPWGGCHSKEVCCTVASLPEVALPVAQFG